MADGQVIFDAGPIVGGTIFADPVRIIRADEPDQVARAIAALVAASADGYWLAGYASYELGYHLIDKLAPLMPKKRATPLLQFGVFEAPAAHEWGPSTGAGLSPPEPTISPQHYRALFERAQEYIQAGDIYQVNVTFPMHARSDATPGALYAALIEQQPVAHGALVELAGPAILSRSPEMFFSVSDDRIIQTRPMKGTVRRGETAREDAKLRDWLAGSEKNRAENLMIVDLLRNDISRVAKIGSVNVPSLFEVETYATVHQMTSLVRGELRKDIGFREAIQALFPCGSVTGAPKIRAMEIIAELETAPRDIYCGAIGWLAPDGQMAFNVAIRTLIMSDSGDVRLNVGGGVIYDSTAEAEYDEALLKARFAFLAA